MAGMQVRVRQPRHGRAHVPAPLVTGQPRGQQVGQCQAAADALQATKRVEAEKGGMELDRGCAGTAVGEKQRQ